MKAVYKYPLMVSGLQDLSLPKGAQFLHVDEQYSVPCLWALVDPAELFETRRVIIAGTGHSLSYDGQLLHIGTFLMNEGALVLHAFELKPTAQGKEVGQ